MAYPTPYDAALHHCLALKRAGFSPADAVLSVGGVVAPQFVCDWAYALIAVHAVLRRAAVAEKMRRFAA